MTGQPVRIGFRTDALLGGGGGHVMRCLSLAQAFEARGATCAFLSVAGTLDLVPALKRSGVTVHDLAGVHEAPDRSVPAFDALVFDSYDLNADDERALAHLGERRVVIDDLANRPHDCDILVDPTWGRTEDAYAAWAPGARLLLGPGHALLRPRFAELRAQSLARRRLYARPDRVLVTFGLSDPGGLTQPVVEALLDGGPQVEAVVPRGAPSWPGLVARATQDERLRLHDDPPDMAELISQVDVVVGAGGGTTWERCCLGAPSIVFVVADNQTDNARALSTAGAAWVIGPGDWRPQLAEALRAFEDAVYVREMAERAAALCDGRGADRVADIVMDLVRDGRGLAETRGVD